VVVNPSKAFTLKSSARLSLTGTATPDQPIIYSDNNPPPYYASAEELLPQQPFPPGTSTPVNVNSPTLKKAIGKARIWVIVSNTVSSTGVGDPLPLELRLEDIVLHATVAKPFEGLDGALGPGGL
jgi:Rad3-related DNA helicase